MGFINQQTSLGGPTLCHCPSQISQQLNCKACSFARPARPAPAQAHASLLGQAETSRSFSSSSGSRALQNPMALGKMHWLVHMCDMCALDFVNLRNELSLAEVKRVKLERQKATRKQPESNQKATRKQPESDQKVTLRLLHG